MAPNSSSLSNLALRILAIFIVACALSSCKLSNSIGVIGGEELTVKEQSSVLPIDENIVQGQLQNGVRYIIRENNKPENFAELRLIVKTGSVYEDDSQRGFAHFAEHMAFNGTTDFKAQEIIEFVESIGMSFGAHLNATTDFENTIYKLRVPTRDPKVIETAIHILQNWANKISFNPQAIDEERGVVLAEWRSRKGVGQRLGKQKWPIIFAGTNYGQRLPIGTKDNILHGNYQDLIRFYKTWYRPDLMSVVAVGDFKAVDIEALIKQYFAPLINPTTRVSKQDQYLTQYESPIVKIITDQELTSTSLSVSWRIPFKNNNGTPQAYRERVIKNLLKGILSKRMTDKTLDTQSAFTAARVGFSAVIPSSEMLSVSANIKPNRTQEAFAELLTVIKRVIDHGVSEQELATEQRLYIEWFESTLKSQNTINNNAYLQSYLKHILSDTPLTSIAQDFALTKDVFANINKDDLQQQMRVWANHQNALIFLMAPENIDASLATNDDLLQIWEQVRNTQTQALSDKAQVTSLMTDIPKVGSVSSKQYLKKWDAHEWILSNGVKVVLKQSTFRENAISFKAISRGGYALVDDDTYLHSYGMMNTLDYMGLGDLNMEQLTQFSREKRFSVVPSVNEYTESMAGSSNKEDLLYMMQSIYLRFTAPVKDANRFEWLKDNTRPQLANKYNSANAQFYAAIQERTKGGNPRNVEFDVAMLNQQNLDTIYRLYKERFANAADFTFVFVGDLDLLKMEEFLSIYVASLPVNETFDAPAKLPNYAMQGDYQVHMRKGIEPKATVILSLFGEAKWSHQNQLVMQAFRSALAKELRVRLREELAGVYTVGVDANLSRWPYQNYALTVSFTCDPERIDELYKEVQGIFAKFKRSDVNPELLENFKTKMLTNHAKRLKENSYWLNQILAQNTPFKPIPAKEFVALVNNIKFEMLGEAAMLYLQSNNILYATLQPESNKSTKAKDHLQTKPD